MLTQNQLDANRRNARRSTGPASAAGKAISSQNARTHGLTAATLQLDGANRERYHELRRELATEVNPQGPIEHLLFARLLRAAWNLERIAEREDRLFTLDEEADPLRRLALLARYRTSNERSFDRALKQLTQLQTNRALRADVAQELPKKTPALTDITHFAKRTRIREGIHQEPAHRIAFDRELALLGQEIKLANEELEAVGNL